MAVNTSGRRSLKECLWKFAFLGHYISLFICGYLAMFFLYQSLNYLIGGKEPLPSDKMLQTDEFLQNRATYIYWLIINFGLVWTANMTLFGVLMCNGLLFMPLTILVTLTFTFDKMNNVGKTDYNYLIHGIMCLLTQCLLFFTTPVKPLRGTKVTEYDPIMRRKVFGFSDLERHMLRIIPPDMRNFYEGAPIDHEENYDEPDSPTADEYMAPFLRKYFLPTVLPDGRLDEAGNKKVRLLNELKRVILSKYEDEDDYWIKDFPLHLIEGLYFHRCEVLDESNRCIYRHDDLCNPVREHND